MIKTQEMTSFPIFAENGQKIQPDTAKYSAGFQESDVLPAEWVNYFENKSSSAITTLNAGVTSIEEELNNLVVAGGQSPTSTDNSQVLKSIQYLINQSVKQSALASYPIGSLYWSSSPKNPSEIFGGTWTQIKDKFVLSAGDTYSVDETGGNATITLTVANLPSHSHSFTPSGTVSKHAHGLNSHTHSFSHTHNYTPSGTVNSSTSASDNKTSGMSGSTTVIHPGHNISGSCSDRASYTDVNGESYNYSTSGRHNPYGISINLEHTHNVYFKGTAGTTTSQSTSTTGGCSTNTTEVQPTFSGTSSNTGNTGSGSSINILPPYVVKYCWERTA